MIGKLETGNDDFTVSWSVFGKFFLLCFEMSLRVVTVREGRSVV
jgi:hypothetical protein